MDFEFWLIVAVLLDVTEATSDTEQLFGKVSDSELFTY